MNKTPIFRSVSCIAVRTPPTVMMGPNGMTAIAIRANVTAMNGARK
jgi:hypothetical protein